MNTYQKTAHPNLSNKEPFILIHQWMISRLGLKGSALLLYACIYGFTVSTPTGYFGTLQYLSRRLEISRQAVHNTLTRLVAEGLLQKKTAWIDGRKVIFYTTMPLPEAADEQASIPVGQTHLVEGEEFLHPDPAEPVQEMDVLEEDFFI